MYVLYIQSVTKWPLPQPFLTKLTNDSQEKCIKYFVSISFYHTVSKHFFGTTWKSCSSDYTDEGGGAITLNEVVIFHSKIIDSNCIAIIELIAEKHDTNNAYSRQISCGFCMIQPFGTNFLDVCSYSREEDDDDAIPLLSSKVYRGTPRKLQFLSHVDFNLLSEGLSSYPGCTINYMLVTNSKMNNDISYIIRENSVISAYDKVVGLELNHSTEYNDRKNILLKERHMLWNNFQLVKLSNDTFHIKIKGITVNIPNRTLFESKVCDAINNTIPKEEAYIKKNSIFGSPKLVKQDISSNHLEDKNTKAKVISRKLKVGVHNGNTLISKSWKNVELESSDENQNEIFLKDADVVVVDGIVRHTSCVILFVLEFTIKPSQTVIRNHTAEARKGSSSTADLFSVIVGFQIFSPFNERKQPKPIKLSFMTGRSIRNFSNDRLYSCDDTKKENDIELKFDIVDSKVANGLKMESRRISMRSCKSNGKHYTKKSEKNKTSLPIEEMLKHENDKNLSKGYTKSITTSESFDFNLNDTFNSSDTYIDKEVSKDYNNEDLSLKDKDLLLPELKNNRDDDFWARPLQEIYNEELEEDLQYIHEVVGRGDKKKSLQISNRNINIANQKDKHDRSQYIAAISSHCAKIGEKTPVQERCEFLSHILSTKENNMHKDKSALVELELLKWFREGQKRNLIQNHIKDYKNKQKEISNK